MIRTKTILLILSVACICAPLPVLAQSCDIGDVIALTEEERSASDIRAECNGRITGAGSCTLTRVMRLAKDGMSEDEIRGLCRDAAGSDRQAPLSPRTATYCQTNFGVCPLTSGMPGPPGGPCYCIFPMGTATGIAR